MIQTDEMKKITKKWTKKKSEKKKLIEIQMTNSIR